MTLTSKCGSYAQAAFTMPGPVAGSAAARSIPNASACAELSPAPIQAMIPCVDRTLQAGRLSAQPLQRADYGAIGTL